MAQTAEAGREDEFWLVLIETLANQAHLFASNKLREIIGASEQIYLSTTQWCKEAIVELGTGNFEIVISASGKAVLLARTDKVARALITRISLSAQLKAPGLMILGAVSDAPIRKKMPAVEFHGALKKLFDKHRRLRGGAGLGDARFLRSPFSADCASTGAAAAGFDKDKYDPDLADGDEARPYSVATLEKRKLLEGATQRLNGVFGGRLDFSGEESGGREAAAAPDWWSVVHADGNGLGQLFLRFDECLKIGSLASDYIDAYRNFSKGLDECTRNAAIKAMNEAWPGAEKNVQLKPVVLAGDDLTVICDGAKAVKFTASFLRLFAEETKKHEHIKPVTATATADNDILKSPALTAAAGVAIVKLHHPFHRAYELAEGLCQSAKACKTAKISVSALDIHVAFDQASDLDAIHQRLTVDDSKDRLWGGPYALSDGPCELNAGGYLRSYAMLEASMAALRQTGGPGKPLTLGRGQQHDLRTALFDGSAAAKVAVARLANRPEINDAFKRRLFGSDEAFDAAFANSTLLLDALDLLSLGAGGPAR